MAIVLCSPSQSILFFFSFLVNFFSNSFPISLPVFSDGGWFGGVPEYGKGKWLPFHWRRLVGLCLERMIVKGYAVMTRKDFLISFAMCHSLIGTSDRPMLLTSSKFKRPKGGCLFPFEDFPPSGLLLLTSAYGSKKREAPRL